MTNTTSSPIADAFAEVQAISETVDKPAKRKTASKPKSKAKSAAKKSPAPKAKSKPAAKKTKAPAKAKEPKAPRVTKEAQMIELLSRPEGASNPELQERFGIQPHSVRGAISTIKSKRGLTVNYDKETGRYSIPSE